MSEQRKQDVAKEYIENNNIEYIGKELNNFKEELNSSLIDVKSILGSEKVGDEDNELEGVNMLGVNGVMSVLFRKDGKQRRKLGYEILKSAFIKEESKQKLDLLFLALKKSKTEQELRNNLREELNSLENNIQNNIDNGNIINNGNNIIVQSSLQDLTTEENREMANLVEKSQNINDIKYLENPTYKKYLNIIERNLNLPKYTLECVCYQESKGLLYEKGHIIGSPAGAQGLFQFMPSTADQYMKHSKLNEKYGKIFSSREEFLKDPLASAWAAGIMYSEFMNKYNYNLQTSLACYNWGIGNYQNKIGKRNLTQGDMDKLPEETRNYVNKIIKDIMEHNSIPSDNIFADLGGYKRNNGNINTGGRNINIDNNPNNILIDGSPELLATNENQIGGLGNSMMVGFQRRNTIKFPNMDGVVGMSTQTHPRRFKSKEDIVDYKNNHQNIKSFMFYFGANTTNNKQTLSDIKNRSEWMQEVGIQPVLCTCIGEDNHPHLTDLNRQIIEMGKENNWPVLDFAKEYNNGQITMGNNLHPDSDGYTAMAGMIKECVQQA